jgi:hypothetical protein
MHFSIPESSDFLNAPLVLVTSAPQSQIQSQIGTLYLFVSILLITVNFPIFLPDKSITTFLGMTATPPQWFAPLASYEEEAVRAS